MWEQLLPGLRIKIFMTILLGVVYPLGMTGVSQFFFSKQANGSLIMSGGKVIGSELIGQNFTKPEYFHPRPSSAGKRYEATSRSRPNLGPPPPQPLPRTTKNHDQKKKEVGLRGGAPPGL